MYSSILQLEQEALNQMKEGNMDQAAKLFQKIISENSSYEHGMSFYNLACCFEELGKFKEAEENFLKAIEYMPSDPIRLGGYASFLYLHGNPQKAFNAYLCLYKLEKKSKGKTDDLMQALKKLGEKIGLTEQEVVHRAGEIS